MSASSCGMPAVWKAVIGAGARGQAVAGPWAVLAAWTAGAVSRNGAPEARFGVQQGVIRRPPGRVAGPCRAAENASSTPQRQDVGPGGAGSRRERRGRAGSCAVRARDRERCAAWKLTHPDAAGELAGPEVQCCWAACTAGAGGRNGAPEARFGVQQGVSGDHLLAWRGLAGPLRAPVPRRSGKMSARVALAAAGSGAVEPVRAP